MMRDEGVPVRAIPSVTGVTTGHMRVCDKHRANEAAVQRLRPNRAPVTCAMPP
jgi:hypothetical protein